MNLSESLNNRNNSIVSVAIIGILFFIFGFITWLNGTLIPFLKISCELNNAQAYLVTFSFYISYFIMAIPSSWVLKKTGFKNGMSVGLLVMSFGTMIFLPAAYTRTFGLFLAGLFIQGTGLAILQTASNPYIAILGPLESAAKRISIMGICNKIAGVISPLILGAIVLKGADALKNQLTSVNDVAFKEQLLNDMALRVVLPYIVMAVSLVILALLVRFSPLPEIEEVKESVEGASQKRSKLGVLKFPHLILGFVAIFFYVGVEVIAGDTIILYGQSQGFPLADAKVFTSYTLIAMLLGYVIGIISIPKFISQEKALTLSAVLGIIFSIAAIYSQGFMSVFFIAILGLANAVMWPAIWPLAINGLGHYTKTGSAILIMGIAGGATLPFIYGKLVDISSVGNQSAYWLLIPCYLFILYYAIKGHKVKYIA